MSHLYHRKLLTDFQLADVENLLDEAIVYTVEQKGSLTESLVDALLIRLKFRKAVLTAVVMNVDVDELAQVSSWALCLELLPALSKTNDVGVAVESSFSAKIQRRLASSVPPRPVVDICFEDASAFLSSLCQYGMEAYRILDFYGSNNILVGLAWSGLSNGLITDSMPL